MRPPRRFRPSNPPAQRDLRGLQRTAAQEQRAAFRVPRVVPFAGGGEELVVAEMLQSLWHFYKTR